MVSNGTAGAGDRGLSTPNMVGMKGRKNTHWFCDRCAMTLTTYVRVLEPPLHYCTGRDKNSTTNNRVALQERRKA